MSNEKLRFFIIIHNSTKKGTKKLKYGKKEENGLNTNHIKHGTNRLYLTKFIIFCSVMKEQIKPEVWSRVYVNRSINKKMAI